MSAHEAQPAQKQDADLADEDAGGEQPGATPANEDEQAKRGDDGRAWRQNVGLVIGTAVFLLVLFFPAPEGLDPDAWRTAAVGLLMAIWWITEALPIPATALVPLVLFPFLGIRSIEAAAAPYANPIIFLFMGGFLIAIAMQAWGLHRRIALRIVRRVGVRPTSIVIGIIIATAFLSMWVSNTATTLMMLPIGLSILTLTRERLAERGKAMPANFGVLMVLSIAYAANIGGTGTLVGTPPNALLAGFMSEAYGVEISFVQWMAVGLPLVVVSLPLMYLVLTRIFPVELEELPGGAEIIEQELAKLGAMTSPEKKVAVVFSLTAVLWMTRPLLERLVPGLSDAGIAMAAALAMFLIPAGGDQEGFVLTWSDAEDLPWGVLILFGGGLSLAAAISESGLAQWIGEGVEAFSGLSVLVVVLAAVAIIVLLTEITSNTATAAAFLPIMGAVAVGMGASPLVLAVPAALGASCAFMLPVATPPNAIVYGSGRVTIPQMGKAGIWLNVLFLFLITALAYLLLGVVFSTHVGAFGF